MSQSERIPEVEHFFSLLKANGFSIRHIDENYGSTQMSNFCECAMTHPELEKIKLKGATPEVYIHYRHDPATRLSISYSLRLKNLNVVIPFLDPRFKTVLFPRVHTVRQSYKSPGKLILRKLAIPKVINFKNKTYSYTKAQLKTIKDTDVWKWTKDNGENVLIADVSGEKVLITEKRGVIRHFSDDHYDFYIKEMLNTLGDFVEFCVNMQNIQLKEEDKVELIQELLIARFQDRNINGRYAFDYDKMEYEPFLVQNSKFKGDLDTLWGFVLNAFINLYDPDHYLRISVPIKTKKNERKLGDNYKTYNKGALDLPSNINWEKRIYNQKKKSDKSQIAWEFSKINKSNVLLGEYRNLKHWITQEGTFYQETPSIERYHELVPFTQSIKDYHSKKLSSDAIFTFYDYYMSHEEEYLHIKSN